MENGIPGYLKNYVYVKNYPANFNNEFIVDGIIKCSCGSEDFTIYREKFNQTFDVREANKKIGELIKYYRQKCNDAEHLSIVNRQNRYFIAKIDFKTNNEYLYDDITELYTKVSSEEQRIPIFVEAVCANCGKKIPIFNSSINGYNGVLGIAGKVTKKDFLIKKKSKCRKCGSEHYKVKLSISNIGKYDLLSEQVNSISSCNWEDAFDWIAVDLKCSGCGRVYKKYLDVETM